MKVVGGSNNVRLKSRIIVIHRGNNIFGCACEFREIDLLVINFRTDSKKYHNARRRPGTRIRVSIIIILDLYWKQSLYKSMYKSWSNRYELSMEFRTYHPFVNRIICLGKPRNKCM